MSGVNLKPTQQDGTLYHQNTRDPFTYIKGMKDLTDLDEFFHQLVEAQPTEATYLTLMALGERCEELYCKTHDEEYLFLAKRVYLHTLIRHRRRQPAAKLSLIYLYEANEFAESLGKDLGEQPYQSLYQRLSRLDTLLTYSQKYMKLALKGDPLSVNLFGKKTVIDQWFYSKVLLHRAYVNVELAALSQILNITDVKHSPNRYDSHMNTVVNLSRDMCIDDFQRIISFLPPDKALDLTIDYVRDTYKALPIPPREVRENLTNLLEYATARALLNDNYPFNQLRTAVLYEHEYWFKKDLDTQLAEISYRPYGSITGDRYSKVRDKLRVLTQYDKELVDDVRDRLVNDLPEYRRFFLGSS